MKHKLMLLGLGAALFLLTACGGEPTRTTDNSPTVPTVQPSPTVAATVQPTATAAPAPFATAATATDAPTAVRVRLEPTAVPASPTTALTVPETPLPTDSTEGDPEEDVAEIRQMIEAYWQAFNDYDADLALSMLEEGYRSLEDELVRNDIGRLKLFRVKLEVTEESPPTPNTDGEYETLIRMKTPVDSRQVRMVFRKIEGQWWIVYSNPAEE